MQKFLSPTRPLSYSFFLALHFPTLDDTKLQTPNFLRNSQRRLKIKLNLNSETETETGGERLAKKKNKRQEERT